MKYLYKLPSFITILFLFFFQTNNVLAKSINNSDFIKLNKKALSLEKSNQKQKAYLLRLKMEEDFDIDKLTDNKRSKAVFYFYICSGGRMFNRTKHRLKENIYFCNKTYELFEQSNTFELKGYDFMETYLDDALSFNYAWYYQFNGERKYQKKAEKHA